MFEYYISAVHLNDSLISKDILKYLGYCSLHCLQEYNNIELTILTLYLISALSFAIHRNRLTHAYTKQNNYIVHKLN